MAQRLFNLAKWSFLKEGESIRYLNPRRRMVVIDVNCPDEVAFYVIQDREDLDNNPALQTDKRAGRLEVDEDRLRIDRSVRGEPTPKADDRAVAFVALCKGRDRLEFGVDGEFELMVEGGNAYVYSGDSTDIATRIVAPVIFTRIANRRERNPHQEMIMWRMQENARRREEQLIKETERRLGAMEKRLQTYAPQRISGASIRAAGKPVSKPVGRTEPDTRKDRKDGEEAGTDKARAKVRAPALDDDYRPPAKTKG